MIGRIKGILIEKESPLLVDVNGLGYEIYISTYSLCRLPNIGETVILHTYLVIREDAHTLFGFFTKEERSLFLALIKVSGIGPKVALSILSSIEPTEFVHYILENNLAGLLRLPGIGRKTAERLIIEMRDKVSGFEFLNVAVIPGKSMSKSTVVHDAINALVTLGYNQNEARRVVLQNKKSEMSCEDLIRLALKELS